MKLAGAAAISGAGGMMYCAVEPYWLRRKAQLIHLKNPLLKNIRILHVSDLHIGNRQQLEFAEKAFLDGLTGRPDLICMTGDFINRKLFNPDACRDLFGELSSRVPTFACLGNHDGGKWVGRIGGYSDPGPVADMLSESGVEVLRNQNTELEIRGQSLIVVGIDDKWSGTMNVEKGFCGVETSQESVRIVLAHNPDMKSDLQNQVWDLMLSGHTHGGQVKIPGVGAPVLPVEDRRFTHGLYDWDNRQLHISSGVGSSCGVRFNCPPEICHLELEGVA